MGCSHSVHILMSINLRIIGMTLRSSSLLTRAPLSGHVIEEEFVIEKRPIEGFFGCSDAEWWKRFSARGADRREAGFSVEEWWRAIRRARLSSQRIFVIMHLFGGERRSEDVQAFVERFAEEAGISVLMATIDLATDYRWDLAREDTQHELLGMMSGFVDLLLLGPPCSTVSRARHLRNSVGIRPVRLRSCFWGRPGLKAHEQARVEEANTLYKHSMALCDRISLYGGGFLWEHPKDPGEHPYPSIFATVEFKELLCRTEAGSVSFDQCVLGGPTQKPTTLAGNCRGLDAFAHCRCPGVDGLHSHESSLGFDGEGHFLTRRLQTYPPGMCSLIARGLIDTCLSWQASGEGPTGFFARGPKAVLAPWSVEASATSCGVSILNEAVEEHVRVPLGDDRLGLYLHVDDTLVLGVGDGAKVVAPLMEEIANNMEAEGFRVPDRRSGDEVCKVVGYEIDARQGMFSLPKKKARLLQVAFMELAGARYICVELLRALVGIWSFGAQLRRELYSIPFTVYHLLDVCEGQFVRLWPSVRRELIAMARAVDFMCLQAADPVSRSVYATDAMGADDVDCGGFGVCVAQASREEFLALMRAGEEPGLSLAERDPDAHNHVFFALQDNRPCASAMTKGRLDPLHVTTVSDSTFVRYQSAVEKFETFLLLFDADPSSAAELDEWLVLYRREAALTRSKLENTLAGIQFFAPCLRGNLPLTKKVIKGLAIEFPSKHAFPMLSRSTKFIACKLADEGEYRLGVCMLLQQATGLRPSEMLGLREHDLLRPNELVPRYVLRLGTNVGTKVGREQTTFFDPDQDPVLAMLLFRLLRATPEQGFLANCGYDHYRRVLSRLSTLLGVHYSPHSCRAGFATEAIIKGELPAVVQRRGRWYSEASFLVYIDVATAMQVEAEFRSRSLVTRMGLPVVVPIEDASADEDSPTAPASQAQPGSAQRRSRVMTPPPQPRVARPSAQRRRVDGTAVLSPSLRAHLASRAGSAAGVAASARSEPLRRGPQRRKQPGGLSYVWKFCSRWLQRLRALLLWGSLAFVLASGPVRDLLVPVQRLMVSTAQVGESAAGALTSLLDGGTQLVTASTSVVRAASVNTLSVAQAAWEGVDLVGMNATNVLGRVLGASAAAIEQWLFSVQGREVLRDPAPSVLDFWVGLLRSQGLHLPVVTAETEALVASGDYWSAAGVVSFAANGLVVFEFRMLRMDFTPRWANPLWQVAGWDAADEYDQILVIAREFAASVPAVNSTWDHVLPLPPATARWHAFVGLCRRVGAVLLWPLCSGCCFLVSMWEYGTMHPLTFGGGLLLATCAQWWLRRQTGSSSPARRWADWARFVELTVLLQGWSLVRRAPGDAALRSCFTLEHSGCIQELRPSGLKGPPALLGNIGYAAPPEAASGDNTDRARAKSMHSKAASTADTVGTAPQSHGVGAGPAICFDAGACELGARVGGVQRAGETSAPASPEGLAAVVLFVEHFARCSAVLASPFPRLREAPPVHSGQAVLVTTSLREAGAEAVFSAFRSEGRVFNIRLSDRRMRAVSEVTLFGGTACLERPPAKLRACGLPGDDQGLSKDFMLNLFAAMGTVAAAVVAFVQAGIAQQDSERAERDSERAQRSTGDLCYVLRNIVRSDDFGA
ncbi:hypothetical protein AK812_SmicGene44843 [Symbiodinium microadriaticum]|uniref:Uncharacterized protein n=1 Tax=Symbiodinium microadriaticum TaxID=2951 RepID=A0A1Q9BXI0_SYMMI|nr:hypothetical protein AK812_SmicGene44843 [Symbiodinium microadriaticum]